MPRISVGRRQDVEKRIDQDTLTLGNERRQRVLLLIDELRLGGAEHVVAQLAKGLNPAKYDVRVCTTRNAGHLAEQLRDEGLHLSHIGRRNRLDLFGYWRLIQLLREFQPDVIHSHLFGSSFWGVVLGNVFRVPAIVAHDHGSTYGTSRVKKLIDRVIRRWATITIVPSKHDYRAVQHALALPDEKLRVIYNGTSGDYPATSSLREELGLSEADIIIGAVGGLRPVKGYEIVISAFESVAQSVDSAHLIVIGEGPERERLERLSARLGLQSKVHLIGARSVAAQFLREVDIFVNSSHSEGLPLSILDASSAGLPVVASAVGGVPEVVRDGYSGYLVPPNDPVALAKALNALIEDPVLRKSMGQNGRSLWRDHFTVDRFIVEVDELYEEVIQRRVRRDRR